MDQTNNSTRDVLQDVIEFFKLLKSMGENIPVPNHVPVNHCHENAGPSNHLPNTTKKKTRRRPRQRKQKNLSSSDTVDNAQVTSQVFVNSKIPVENNKKIDFNKLKDDYFTYNIKAVVNQKYGKFIRTRNTKCKRIKLKTFTQKKCPCVFVTEPSQNLVSKMSKLDISSSQQDPSTSSTEKPKSKKRDKEKKQKKERKAKFEKYLSIEEVKLGLASGALIKGFIRINAKNSKEAYVSNENTSQNDYHITSIVDRNGALEGDEVVLKLLNENSDAPGKKPAKVVYILKEVHPRTCVGVLKRCEGNFATFTPRDRRIPQLSIPRKSWPEGFKENPKHFENTLFVAKITNWTNPNFARATIQEGIGTMGDIKVESLALLKEHCMDTAPFPPNILNGVKLTKDIPAKEFEYREDLRDQCVFTIDPLTARDLDDAVSVKFLDNGNYEIGVHISDVAFYLEDGTELDRLVSDKATTIYLVDNVYHMLPVEMCLHCSLLPGQDKLAFSVFWEITQDAQILSTRFTRSIINSCTQLAYEHAQKMIDEPNRKFEESELPKIFHNYGPHDLSRTVNVLQKIAQKLRKDRFEKGALKIDQIKLYYSVDPATGLPSEFRVAQSTEANRLIEEFMLLANISVARKITDQFPDLAFLRLHEPPKNVMLVELQKQLETYGIHIDISSSKGLNSSLQKYSTQDSAGYHRQVVLNHLIAKPMIRARYFCAGAEESEENFKHYALSFDIYTHFTSPIRRYADIMVHRLMSAALGYTSKPNWDISYVCAIANNCNLQKYNAKKVGEASSDLFLCHYVEHHQPQIQDAVVVDVREKSFDAIVLNTGSVIRVYQNTCENNVKWESIPTSAINSSNSGERQMYQIKIVFPATKDQPQCSMLVEIFTLITVNLQRKQKTHKLEGILQRPKVG